MKQTEFYVHASSVFNCAIPSRISACAAFFLLTCTAAASATAHRLGKNCVGTTVTTASTQIHHVMKVSKTSLHLPPGQYVSERIYGY